MTLLAIFVKPSAPSSIPTQMLVTNLVMCARLHVRCLPTNTAMLVTRLATFVKQYVKFRLTNIVTNAMQPVTYVKRNVL